jgi:shikimate kinase
MIKTNIALIGFMGTGKTSVAKCLCEYMGLQLIEIDDTIMQTTGKSISDIFDEEDGPINFRELEIDAIKKASQNNYSVISCGGGAVLNQINIDRLRKNSYIVLLSAYPETISERLEHDQNRPVLNVSNKLEKIKEVMEQRDPLYRMSAELEIDTNFKTIEQVTEEILNKIPYSITKVN